MHAVARKLLAITLVAALSPPCLSELRYRWVYLATNLLVDSQEQAMEKVMVRAKRAGFNGIMLADYKMEVLDLLGENHNHYFSNVEKLKAKAAELGLEIYPALSGPGYAAGLLAHDPNLAEGFPVRGSVFVAHGGHAEVMADPEIGLKDGSFESANGDKFVGWEWQDDAGKTTFADRAIVHGGIQSLRMEGAANPDSNCRIVQMVKLAPHRQYHISAWVKTDGFERPGNTRIAVLTPEGKSLNFTDISLQTTQDWKQVDVVFNSQDATRARVYLGVWDIGKGKLWWDDAKFEETGLLNVLRRPACPVVVRDEAGKSFKEGVDYAPIADPKMGTVPWPGAYEIFHPGPAIKLLPGSRIREGQRLLVDYFHPVVVMTDQVAICMSDPKTYELVKKNAELVNQLFSPPGLFFGHDEIRVINQDAECQARGLTAGQILADNFKRSYKIARDINPLGKIFVWSDMFDPYHNGVSDYYLSRGTLAGSWEGVPKAAIIVNWNFGKRKDSMAWFAGRGHGQILAGYYDSNPASIRTWLDDAKGVSGIVGVMYTTWQQKYDDLEAFAKSAWGEPKTSQRTPR